MKKLETAIIKFICLFITMLLLRGCACSGTSSEDRSRVSRTPGNFAAVWAFPDRVTVTGQINAGVVSYCTAGIAGVDFTLDDGPAVNIAEETLNPDTNEYEFVYTLDTTLLPDGQHTINAAALSGSLYQELPELTIFAANSTLFNTWYVDISAADGDENGDGSEASPWRTIERALGIEWGAPSAHAQSGDTVLVRTGVYELPDGQYGEFTQYVTIKPDEGHTVTIQGGGSIRSSFLKFENINFAGTSTSFGSIAAYSDHIWFKNCTYTGKGKIWPDTGGDEFIRSRDDSHDVIVENCTVHDSNQGISVIGQENYIVRNNLVYDQNGDGMKFQGSNILITGNTIHHIMAPKAWSLSKNAPPYNCDGITLVFHLSSDYGATFPETFNVGLSGAGQTAEQVVTQMNNDPDFTGMGFTAEISASPYPFIGNIRIEKGFESERDRFYITGDTSGIFAFSDNTRDLNDISSGTPAMCSTDHCDYIANDARDCGNVIIRNNRMYGGACQGIKTDGIGGGGVIDFYKDNCAIINNLIEGSDISPRLMYFAYHGSGTPSSVLHYDNILIAHNTIFKEATGSVRSCFTMDMSNPYISDFFVMNNIIGDYFMADYPLEDSGMGMMDYNLYTDDTHQGGYGMSNNSILGDPMFTDRSAWDFSIQDGSAAAGEANPALNIRYDIDWNPRKESPSIGCYE